MGMGGDARFELTGLEHNRAVTLTESEARELYSELRQAFEAQAAEESSPPKQVEGSVWAPHPDDRGRYLDDIANLKEDQRGFPADD
jgi:hypothetical protein